MFRKKLLAVVSTIALSLGLVAVTAAPASAHHSTISASVQCSSPTSATITWKVQNWNGGKTGKVVSSTNSLVPAGTLFASNEAQYFPQSISATGNYSLAVTMIWQEPNGSWANQTTNDGSIHVKTSDFKACEEDDTESKKVDICHVPPGNPDKYIAQNVSVASIFGQQGHDAHGPGVGDIIPPFSYVEKGVAKTYPGKNWTAYNQLFHAAGCDEPDVTPAAATFTDEICNPSGNGETITGSYTIPSTANVSYQVSINGATATTKTAGTYAVAAGTQVTVTPVAASGYDLVGDTGPWSHTFTSAGLCPENVTPAVATFTDEICNPAGTGTVSGSYTIPSTANVSYQVSINGATATTKAAGSYTVAAGTQVTVTPVAATGYTLVGDTGPWSRTFASAGACLDEVTPTAPTFQDDECTAEPGESTGASYTIPSTEGVKYQVYRLIGGWTTVAAGEHVYLSGGTVSLRAVALTGYELTGTTSWSHTFGPWAGLCLVDATPGASYELPQCVVDEPGTIADGSYTLDDVTGVIYFVKVGDGSWTKTAAGTYPVSAGTTVYIYAIGDVLNGYKIPGPLSQQDFGPWTFTAPEGECIVDAVPVDPTVTPQTCEVDEFDLGTLVSGWITIPASEGVQYLIDGTEYAAGDHQFEPGTYQVTAEALPGYELDGYPEGGWSLTIEESELCGDLVTFPLVTPTVTFAQIGCDAAGSYTLATVEGFSGAIVWTVVTGPNTDGTHAVASAQTVNVSAAPAEGYGFAFDQQTEWEFAFVAPAACGDLTTLALTGGAVTWGALNLAALAVGLGVVLVAVRRREVSGTE